MAFESLGGSGCIASGQRMVCSWAGGRSLTFSSPDIGLLFGISSSFPDSMRAWSWAKLSWGGSDGLTSAGVSVAPVKLERYRALDWNVKAKYYFVPVEVEEFNGSQIGVGVLGEDGRKTLLAKG